MEFAWPEGPDEAERKESAIGQCATPDEKEDTLQKEACARVPGGDEDEGGTSGREIADCKVNEELGAP